MMECPDCGGPMWDNRDSKRNPKQPDYKCKDRDCGKAVWEKKRGGNTNGTNGNNAAPREKWTWGDLFQAYTECHKRVAAVQGEKASPESLNSGVATLLIAAKDHNLPGPVTAKKRAEAAKAEAEKKAEREAMEEEYQDDSDLPY